MATGIGFMKWTEHGRRNYRETVDRFESALKLAGNFGVEVKEIYWTPGGPYDLIGIAEGSDIWKLSAFALALQSVGNLDITWVEACRPEEMREMLASADWPRTAQRTSSDPRPPVA